MEADAAAARDVVSKAFGWPLNFTKPRKITGHRSKGADQAVADAVNSANSFVLGNSRPFFWANILPNSLQTHHTMPRRSPKLEAQTMAAMKLTTPGPPLHRRHHRHYHLRCPPPQTAGDTMMNLLKQVPHRITGSKGNNAVHAHHRTCTLRLMVMVLVSGTVYPWMWSLKQVM